MNIHISMHDFIGATAHVNSSMFGEKRQWFCVIHLDDHTDLFTGYFQTKVEALMGAFDLVDTLKTAVQKLADDEGMRDLQDSVEMAQTEKDFRALLADSKGDPDYEREKAELSALVHPLLKDASDGPVADSVDGYKVKEEA